MRIVLCTDQPILAEGLAAVLDKSGWTLERIVNSMPELLAAIASAPPDIVLLDLTEEITFAALGGLKEAAPEVKIVLWAHSISTELAFQAMGLGVRGILRKTLPTALLTKCLEKVSAGELWFQKELTDSFLQAKRIALTRREGELIALLAQGLKNKEIGARLGIGEGTVKVYLCRLFKKTGANDRFELALYGVRNLAVCHGAGGSPPSADLALPLPGLRSLVMAAHLTQ